MATFTGGVCNEAFEESRGEEKETTESDMCFFSMDCANEFPANSLFDDTIHVTTEKYSNVVLTNC